MSGLVMQFFADEFQLIKFAFDLQIAVVMSRIVSKLKPFAI